MIPTHYLPTPSPHPSSPLPIITHTQSLPTHYHYPHPSSTPPNIIHTLSCPTPDHYPHIIFPLHPHTPSSPHPIMHTPNHYPHIIMSHTSSSHTPNHSTPYHYMINAYTFVFCIHLIPPYSITQPTEYPH